MTNNPENKNLYKASGVVALTLGIFLLVSAAGFILSLISSGFNNAKYSLFQSNWLIIIFKLHSGLINIQDNPLYGLHVIDLIFLVLFCLMSAGLYRALKKVNKIWPLVAFALSAITIILYIATRLAGRSTVMLSVMIYSFVMLRNKMFKNVAVYMGIFAGVFLFVGDFSVVEYKETSGYSF